MYITVYSKKHKQQKPMTNGINCISCVGWSNAGCNDSYDEATSGDHPVAGNT
jgi:hypothetical protein